MVLVVCAVVFACNLEKWQYCTLVKRAFQACIQLHCAIEKFNKKKILVPIKYLVVLK
jgi:hypothetical protein